MNYIKLLLKTLFITFGISGAIHIAILTIDSLISKDISQLNLYKILQLEKFINTPIFENSQFGFISLFAYYLIITGIYIILNQKKVSE